MSWITSLLSQGGQGAGQFIKGFAGGYGEGLGIPQLAGKFTRAEGVTGKWADIGRQLGELQGKQSPAAIPAAGLSKLFELARRPSPSEEEIKKRKKKMIGDFIIPSEKSYMAGEE